MADPVPEWARPAWSTFQRVDRRYQRAADARRAALFELIMQLIAGDVSRRAIGRMLNMSEARVRQIESDWEAPRNPLVQADTGHVWVLHGYEHAEDTVLCGGLLQGKRMCILPVDDQLVCPDHGQRKAPPGHPTRTESTP